MKKWTREERYQKLEDIPDIDIKNLEKIVLNCSFRQKFHIQPKTGLLNDPNGFSYFNGKYHLFYQWFPLGSVHGLKYWYHVSSLDLVNWDQDGIGIYPGDKNDSHGAYSGSGIVHNNKLYLIYTGNIRDYNWIRDSKQCLAIMDKESNIIKQNKPVIDSIPEGYTEHFRDPKIFKKDDLYYCFIGAQRNNLTGCIVYYQSKNLINWNLVGELNTSLNKFGYMWECPDYFELDNKGIVIFSPQGIKESGDLFNNIYQSGYLIGDKVDFSNRSFSHGSFIELDRGFDFYAPQTMEDNKGNRILIGWMGLPDINYPTDKNGWANCLTLPRILEIRNNKIIQRPIDELYKLQKSNLNISDSLINQEKSYDGFNGIEYNLKCKFKNIIGKSVGVKLRTSLIEETMIYYDIIDRKVVFDRSKSGEKFAIEYGEVRKCFMDGLEIEFNIFVDRSSVEIFINNGQEVFTSRIFPSKKSDGIIFFTKGQSSLEADIYQY